MSGKGLFVTGTDTGIGKTWVTLSLMRALRRAGLSVVGMKPVASGAEWRNGRLVNEDALAIQHAGTVGIPYEMVNPYVYEPPVSPHIAASLSGRFPDFGTIAGIYGELAGRADCVIVEGVGGWLAPLGDREDVSGLALCLGLPVLMVAGLRLGCINHARLTHQAILASGARHGGWVANHLEVRMPWVQENIRTLRDLFGREPLAEIPFQAGSDILSGGGWNMDEVLRMVGP